MKLPCSKCGKLFEVERPTSIMNICPSCQYVDSMGKAPDILTDIFKNFK